jgi:hypothetical protein
MVMKTKVLLAMLLRLHLLPRHALQWFAGRSLCREQRPPR